MNHKEIRLCGDEVISLKDKNDQFLIGHTTFKCDELIARLKTAFKTNEPWFSEGVDCEILHPGKRWMKGKIRIRMEFCLNELETIDSTHSSADTDSELDSIRQMLGEDK